MEHFVFREIHIFPEKYKRLHQTGVKQNNGIYNG